MQFDFLRKYFTKKGEQVIHLDYAATTPVHPVVRSAMEPFWSDAWANPSAIYRAGVRARAAIDAARTTVARLLHVRPEDVVFTSGGTEANTLALWGVIEQARAAGRAYSDMRVLTTAMEHPSVLSALKMFRERGVEVVYVAVHEDGIIDVHDVAAKLTPETVLVTFAYVNSEVGVIAPVKQISRVVKKFNQQHGTSVRVHLDASQAPLWLSCEMDMLGVDLVTLDAGKCYGPKGAGVLARKHGVEIVPLIVGGDQEQGIRAGTENTALVVGCATALERAQQGVEARGMHVAQLRDHMIARLEAMIPGVLLNGSRSDRVANNVNISIPGIDTEFAVITLDAHGIAASTKSACGGKKGNGSGVVRAMTHDDARARSTIRFTLGEETTKDDIDRAVLVLAEHVRTMRAFHESLQNPQSLTK